MQRGSPDDCRCLGDPDRQDPRRGWPSGSAAISSRVAGLACDPWLCGPPAGGLVLRTAITPPGTVYGSLPPPVWRGTVDSPYAVRSTPASLAGYILFIVLTLWPKQLVEDFRRVV